MYKRQDTLRMKLKESHLEYEFRTYNGYTDRETAAALAQYVREQGFEVVAGAGGGRIMDLVKAVAHLAGTPVVTIPTSAATCAAYTPMSVMYTKDCLLYTSTERLILTRWRNMRTG